MYIQTLFVDPFPGVLKLNAWVLDVWREGEKELAKVDQSTKSRALVSVHTTFKTAYLTFSKLCKYHSRIRSHFVSELKKTTLSLFNLDHLKHNPQGLAEHVQYSLDDDQFLCLLENYEVKDLPSGHGTFSTTNEPSGSQLETSLFRPHSG